MSIRISRKSTRMDRQGKIFVPRDIAKAMALNEGGKIEFFATADGGYAFRKVKDNR